MAALSEGRGTDERGPQPHRPRGHRRVRPRRRRGIGEGEGGAGGRRAPPDGEPGYDRGVPAPEDVLRDAHRARRGVAVSDQPAPEDKEPAEGSPETVDAELANQDEDASSDE